MTAVRKSRPVGRSGIAALGRVYLLQRNRRDPIGVMRNARRPALSKRSAPVRQCDQAALGAGGRIPPRRGSDQYESELMTSPPAIEPRPTQMGKLIEFLKNWTEPSARSEFTPPECRLREAAKPAPSFVCEKQGRF